MPLELLATAPPMVQADSLAGAGPSLRRYRASRVLTARTVAPGCTRTRAPSSSTSIQRKLRRVVARDDPLVFFQAEELAPGRGRGEVPGAPETRESGGVGRELHVLGVRGGNGR